MTEGRKHPTMLERLGVMINNLIKPKHKFKGAAILRKSSKKITHPPWSEKENRCFIMKMMLHGLEAYMLLDSGCMSDSISLEFATSVNLKVHELEEPVPLQLGTIGSRSKINFRLFSKFKHGKTEGKHYFDVVNIDRYDSILGTVFMRKHGAFYSPPPIPAGFPRNPRNEPQTLE
jgi:hypothetical protein